MSEGCEQGDLGDDLVAVPVSIPVANHMSAPASIPMENPIAVSVGVTLDNTTKVPMSVSEMTDGSKTDDDQELMSKEQGEEGTSVKLLGPGGLIVTTDDLSGGDAEADRTILATSMLGHDMVPLSVVGSQAAIPASFEHGVIFVTPADNQMSVASDQSLLLGSDSHNSGLSLEHGELVTQTGENGEEEKSELVTSNQDGEQFIIQQDPGNMKTSPKLVSLDPQVLGISSAHAGLAAGLNPNQFQNLMLTTATGETVQVIAIQNLFSDISKNKVVQVPVGSSNVSAKVMQLTGNSGEAVKSEEEEAAGSSQVLDFGGQGLNLGDSLAGILVSAPVVQKVLPPGTPQWAARINDCEKIGDSYRGWVGTEMDLDLLLTYHKQQTQSFWGTRQSPSPAKPSTRLMWKSQYVPFDGIPFINAGSRAIVLECQYGPRRKTAQSKRQNELPKGGHKQACPARIYIKKVKKYPSFAVEIGMDKKMLKIAMDKAFLAIKDLGAQAEGQERYYIQLPTEEAHEFHGESVVESPHRLEPRVAEKIRELVSAGETRLYAIRKALRRFVEKELFTDRIPEKHNLTYYPTVNDLQNHIHQAVRDMEAGVLPVTAPTVKVEMLTGDSSSNDEGGADPLPLWNQLAATDGQPHTESVTVTLTQNPGEDGEHVISKVETHMSDGTTQVTTNLTPETARLLSKLHPNIFPGVMPSQMESLPERSVADQLGTLSGMQTSDLHDDMNVLTNTQTQYVVMEDIPDEEGIPNGEGIPGTEGIPNSDVIQDTDSSLMLTDSGVSVVEIDPDMQLREEDGEGLSVAMDVDSDSGLKLIPAKLVSDGEDLVSYGDCVSMTTDGMPVVVATGLEEGMDSTQPVTMII